MIGRWAGACYSATQEGNCRRDLPSIVFSSGLAYNDVSLDFFAVESARASVHWSYRSAADASSVGSVCCVHTHTTGMGVILPSRRAIVVVVWCHFVLPV